MLSFCCIFAVAFGENAERDRHFGSEVEQRIRNAWVPSSNLGSGSKGLLQNNPFFCVSICCFC